MIKVKLSINSPTEGLLRQTPNNDGVWGNINFILTGTLMIVIFG